MKNKQPFDLARMREILFLIDFFRDFLPGFEQRMINRELRWRRRHAEGKISEERLQIELDAIRQKRLARAGKG